LGGGCLLWASPVAPFSCGEAEGKLPPELSRLVRGTSAGGRSGLWRCCPLGARGGRQLQAVLWWVGSLAAQLSSNAASLIGASLSSVSRERKQKQGQEGGGRGPRAVCNRQEQEWDQGGGQGPGEGASWDGVSSRTGSRSRTGKQTAEGGPARRK
jgi:hypothetical protein